jgi:thiol:disulfide interchange protein
MNRRGFLSISALALSSTAGLASAQVAATQQYSPALYEQLLASGEPFMLNFYADW